MASNAKTVQDQQGQYDDWIEIHNPGNQAVDVGGMYLTDDPALPTLWRTPTGTTIPAGGYLLIWLDEDTTDTGMHAGFRLDTDGEILSLYDKDGTTLIDSVSFGAQVVDVSYGRYPNATGSFQYMGAPTPAKANSSGYLGVVADVEYSHERGFYDLPFDLEMTCPTPGAVIYFTTDGSAPVEDNRPGAGGMAYTKPVPIPTTTCIRAAAVKSGWLSSRIDTHTFLFDADETFRSMPVVSLVGDEHKTFFEPDGIMAIVGGYYNGSGVWQSSGQGSYNNVIKRGRAYERPVSFEVLDARTGLCIQTDCGIRVHGSDYTRPRYTRGDEWLTCWNGWPSMNSNKFSFNLYFRDAYGPDRLECAFFPFIEVDRFKSIVLRGGHNDACAPFVKDEWARRLFREMGGVQVTGTFANLYLNGQYKGYYNPSSRLDNEFLQEWYKTDNAFDMINQAGLREGTWDAWNGLLAYADGHNLANTADYDYVAARLDIPLFIDFLILEIYIANFDWPGNNWEVHRERSDAGIFRFSVWDAEGLAETWAVGSNYELTAFEDYPTWANPRGLNHMSEPNSRLYRALKANPRFRQLFADHVHRHFRNGGILTPSHLLARWWEVFGEVSKVLPETELYPVRFVPDQFIPNREAHVLAAFDRNGLFDQDFGAPVFHVNGVYQHGGYAATDATLTMANLNGSGTVYYTLDSTDPAVPGAAPQEVQDGVLVTESATKRVLVPIAAVAEAWKGGSPFNDITWRLVSGSPGGVGYETQSGYDPYIGLDLESQMYGKTTGCYVRIPFAIAEDPGTFDRLTLRVRYDDGFVAYINGEEAHRELVNGTPQWNSVASGNHESGGLETFDLSGKASLLRKGQNVLALHGLNVSTTSSDFILSAELAAGHTVNGTEPGASDTAIAYTGPIPLTRSVCVKARVLSGQAISALNEAVFAVGPVKECLCISEIMYHPLDPNAEFVELTNIGSAAINLNLVRFTQGIDFTFGDVALAPGGYVLVVKDKAAFQRSYPSFSGLIAGQWSGSLDNAGERIELRDALGQTILDFTYKDDWYDDTDGKGLSLTVKDPAHTDPNAYGNKSTWRTSPTVGGSPGSGESKY